MFITGTSMVCSVGLNAASAAAAIRAGICRFRELSYQSDRGEPIVGAVVPKLLSDEQGSARVALMLSWVLVECRKALPAGTGRIPLLIALAEIQRPGGCGAQAAELLRGVLGEQFDPRLSEVIAGGNTAGFEALRRARELLASQQASACVVCGVDSLLNAATLDWLEGHWRLKTAENSDGIVPGEGAAAVVLSRFPAGGRTAAIRVSGLGFANEPAHILGTEPLLGVGLAAAASAALSEGGVQMQHIDFRISDLAGEQYGFKEQALMVSRTLRQRRPDFPLWHPADCIGDIGAAAGIAQIVCASAAFQRGYAPGPHALLCTGGVTGKRAVAVLRNEYSEGVS